MIASSSWFHTFRISASLRRRSMRKSRSTLGSTALVGTARRHCPFSSGTTSTPRHWARTLRRLLFFPGPTGGSFAKGKRAMIERGSGFGRSVFIQHQHAVGLQVVIAGEGIAREEIVHWFVERDSDRGTLVVQKKENAGVIFLTHAN